MSQYVFFTSKRLFSCPLLPCGLAYEQLTRRDMTSCVLSYLHFCRSWLSRLAPPSPAHIKGSGKIFHLRCRFTFPSTTPTASSFRHAPRPLKARAASLESQRIAEHDKRDVSKIIGLPWIEATYRYIAGGNNTRAISQQQQPYQPGRDGAQHDVTDLHTGLTANRPGTLSLSLALPPLALLHMMIFTSNDNF